MDIRPILGYERPRHAVISGYGDLAHGIRLPAHDREQTDAVHLVRAVGLDAFMPGFGKHGLPVAERIHHGRRDIHILDETFDPLPTLKAGHMDEQRNMDQFLIGPGAALAHDAVPVFAVAHGLAVVRGDDHHRLVPKPLLADRIEQVADPFVHEFHFFHVQGADMGALLFRHHALDLGPRGKDHRIALIVRVMRARFPFPDGRRIPRFMGIERVHPHQERPLRIAFAPKPVVGFPGDDADIVVGIRLPELTLLEVALGFPDQ